LLDWLLRRQHSRVKKLGHISGHRSGAQTNCGRGLLFALSASIPLSDITGMKIFCKLDNLQRTGSFKERGARNALAQLSRDQQKRGVIAASAGNHAQALAYQGRLLGIPATVVMPEIRALIKVSTCQQLGATVVLHGTDFGEARAHAHKIAARKALPISTATMIPRLLPARERWAWRSLSKFPISRP
jgi:threonine dehydratase